MESRSVKTTSQGGLKNSRHYFSVRVRRVDAHMRKSAIHVKWSRLQRPHRALGFDSRPEDGDQSPVLFRLLLITTQPQTDQKLDKGTSKLKGFASL